MHTVDVERYRAAAEAAGVRAAECRARREQLQARRPCDTQDLAHARKALERAQRRADIAAEAASDRSRQFRVAGTRVPTSPPLPPNTLRAWLTERGADLDELHVAYLSLGGIRTMFELDAFANGLVDFGYDQRGILQHAMWELDEFRT